MEYRIRETRIENLKKRIKRIAHKCPEGISFEFGDPVFKKGYDKQYHKYYTVKVNGEYRINGWQYVAQLVHMENGNVINKAVDIAIPYRYYCSEPVCEHCHKKITRKVTYIIRNIETGIFKEVGSSCLQEYTNGLCPDKICALMEILQECEDESNESCDSSHEPMYYSSSTLVKVAMAAIKEKGYNKVGYGGMPTGDYINKNYKELEEKGLEEFKDISGFEKFIEDSKDKSEYFHNGYVLLSEGYVESSKAQYIASLVSCYNRNIEDNEPKHTTKYIGEVGDRVTFIVEAFRVLLESESQFGTSYTYKIMDDKGNTIIWKTERSIEEGMAFKATVKGHKEFKGIKQTVITRGTAIAA